MRAMTFAGIVLSAVVFTGGAAARGGCANTDEVATLQIAEMQQQLMVAAYTCHEVRAYNRFVIAYRPQLQRSDRDMLALFKRKDGSRGFADYNAFKTRLANLSALDANRDGDFCSEARSTFHAAFSRRASLVRIAMERRQYASLPFSACGRTHFADAGPGLDARDDDRAVVRNDDVAARDRYDADGAPYDDEGADSPSPSQDGWRSRADDDRDSDDESDDDDGGSWWPF